MPYWRTRHPPRGAGIIWRWTALGLLFGMGYVALRFLFGLGEVREFGLGDVAVVLCLGALGGLIGCAMWLWDRKGPGSQP